MRFLSPRRVVPLGALMLLLVPALALAQPRPAIYVVQPGDTLYRIATEQGMSVEALRRLNGLDGDVISVGQRLRLTNAIPLPDPRPDGTDLPGGPPPGDAPRPPVRAEGAPPARPVPLSSAAAPPQAPAAEDREVYTVRAGDTLFGIALQFDTTVEALRRLNNIQGDRIDVGQRLVVAPGGGGNAGASPVPERPWRIDETNVPADLVHFVEPGETLYSIAVALGLRVEDLTSMNRLTTAPLEPGHVLRLPRPVDPRWAAEPRPLPAADTVGLALVYPSVMVGRPLASGAPYDPAALTASHRTLPLGTVVLVTNPASGRSTFVTVEDRGPVSQSYLLELSEAAADVLDLDPNAARRVELRTLP
ncbi:MAG: LysM peptidoglycan-binding domain-containing protein [Rubricoccaceae bacterium]|nr:LysM peptidoglycan-binding domain-containing protein [Rubricoccaceae bacterium]